MTGNGKTFEIPGWLVAVLCVLSALLSISHAPAAPPDRAPLVRGISALPGGAVMPEADRPPGALPDDGGPSSVIFPEQRIPLRFNHRKHVLELGLPCTECHTRAKSSTQSRDRLLPSPNRCDRCHGSDHSNLNQVMARGQGLDSDCGFCHLGHRSENGNQVQRVELPLPNLKFDHRVHAERNIGCAQCHGAVERLEHAGRDQLPRMLGCLVCHGRSGEAAGAASGECTTCHLSDGPRLKTQFASGTLVPPYWLKDAAHGPDWLLRHRSVAGDDSRFCASCHEEKECVDCHDGRVRPRRIHPNDFLSLHAALAKTDSPRCSSCHQKQSFCLSCHQRSGVTATGPNTAMAQRGRFHPPASLWTNAPRSAGHHAWEAQRNLNVCISCHTERDCVSCHSTREVGGPGGLPAGMGRGLDPHPPGFRSRCGQALRRNARPCLVCHDPADPKLSECR
jgi:hypothetical protein